MTIYDGATNKSAVLGVYCGSTSPPPLVSSTNIIFMNFFSDASITDIGFKLEYNSHVTASSVTTTNRTSIRDGSSPPLGCHEMTRKIVLQLKMIEWGIYGLSDGTAGMFLANHYSTLGPYFGDNFGHDWPHSPLLKKPSHLELAFHQLMTKIMEELTNSKIKNVSMLDFPAFGSMIGQMNINDKMKSNWQIEVNFEVLKGLDGNPQEMFTLYKKLLDDWKSYLIKVRQKDPHAHFSAIMQNNPILNFTDYIKDDMKSFMMSIQASYLNPRKDSPVIWRDIAQRIFKSKNDDAFVSDRGVYDKLIMTCALRKNLLKKTSVDHKEGCDLFHPTLTTKGFCYTFNGQTPSETWKTKEIIDVFNDLFPSSHSDEHFYGAGKEEGNIS